MRQQRSGAVRAVVVLLAVLVSAAGCASARHRPAASGGTTDARIGGPPAGSRAEADALAWHLLSALILPPGARRLAPRPGPGMLTSPAFTTGGTDVDRYRYFRLPVNMRAAQRYLRTHPPAGLTFTMTGTAGAGSTLRDVLEADAPPSAVAPGIEGAELEYTMAPGADGGSLLRADAQVIIYPARSAAEYLNLASVRSVTVTATGAHAGRRTITSRPQIARLTHLADGLHALPPRTGPAGCPFSDIDYQLTFTPVPPAGQRSR